MDPERRTPRAEPAGGLLILVPTLNEAANVEAAITRIGADLPDAHMLVVDDDSRDGTVEIAERHAAADERVHVMVRRGKTPGLGDSIRDAYGYALEHGYTHVCIVDCDLQQDPADVRRMMEAHPGADLVVGSRYLGGHQFTSDYPKVDLWLSALANFGVRVLFGMQLQDVTTDFYVINSRVLEAIDPARLGCRGYGLFSEVKIRARRAGFRMQEVAVPSYRRVEGASKRTLRQVRTFAREILALWWALMVRGDGRTGGTHR